MSRTPDDFPGTRFEDETIHLDQYGADPSDLGSMVFTDGYFLMKDQYGIFNPRDGGVVAADPNPHADTHIGGGSDEIDGDQLDIDFTPTFYAPTITPPEVDAYDDLSAHLAGIDAYLGSISGGGGINDAEHRSLRHLIHFIDGGPALEFASGAFKETLPSGSPFPTSEIWYESAAKLDKIVELSITRGAGKRPVTEEWKMYDTDGSSVLETITDTILYSGPFETTRTRTIA